MEEEAYKVCVIGDSTVGKTTLINKYATQKFTEDTMPTIGNSYVPVTVNLGVKNIGLNLWDTAGQERFRSLVPLYAREAFCVIIVFDLSLPQSFYNVEEWYNCCREEVGLKCPIILCGNKEDMENEIDLELPFQWAREHDCEYFMTSAKSGHNITELFLKVANQCINYNINRIKEVTTDDTSKIIPKSSRCYMPCC